VKTAQRKITIQSRRRRGGEGGGWGGRSVVGDEEDDLEIRGRFTFFFCIKK